MRPDGRDGSRDRRRTLREFGGGRGTNARRCDRYWRKRRAACKNETERNGGRPRCSRRHRLRTKKRAVNLGGRLSGACIGGRIFSRAGANDIGVGIMAGCGSLARHQAKQQDLQNECVSGGNGDNRPRSSRNSPAIQRHDAPFLARRVPRRKADVSASAGVFDVVCAQ